MSNTIHEETFFWNYYHKGYMEPGSYINIEVIDGKPYINESTHGCGGSYKTVDMDVLIEFIILIILRCLSKLDRRCKAIQNELWG